MRFGPPPGPAPEDRTAHQHSAPRPFSQLQERGGGRHGARGAACTLVHVPPRQLRSGSFPRGSCYPHTPAPPHVARRHRAIAGLPAPAAAMCGPLPRPLPSGPAPAIPGQLVAPRLRGAGPHSDRRPGSGGNPQTPQVFVGRGATARQLRTARPAASWPPTGLGPRAHTRRKPIMGLRPVSAHWPWAICQRLAPGVSPPPAQQAHEQASVGVAAPLPGWVWLCTAANAAVSTCAMASRTTRGCHTHDARRSRAAAPARPQPAPLHQPSSCTASRPHLRTPIAGAWGVRPAGPSATQSAGWRSARAAGFVPSTCARSVRPCRSTSTATLPCCCPCTPPLPPQQASLPFPSRPKTSSPRASTIAKRCEHSLRSIGPWYEHSSGLARVLALQQRRHAGRAETGHRRCDSKYVRTGKDGRT